MQLFLKLLKADILLKLYNYLLEMEVLVLGKVLVLGFLSCIGIGIVNRPSKLLVLVLVLVLLRRFPKVLVLVLGRNFGIAHLCRGFFSYQIFGNKINVKEVEIITTESKILCIHNYTKYLALVFFVGLCCKKSPKEMV